MSTEFRIGMSEGRSSSRVLKPPGGGHSQIFGGAEEEAPRRTPAKTEIASCFAEEESDAPQQANGAAATNGGAAAESDADGSGEGMKSELNAAHIAEGTPQRKRVPPGGFSSGGFW